MGANNVPTDMQGAFNEAVTINPATGKGELRIFHSQTVSTDANVTKGLGTNKMVDRAFVWLFGINAITTIRVV